MASIVHKATLASIVVQAITGVVGFYGLSLPVSPRDAILREVLGLEMLVQSVEFIFYMLFLFTANVALITQERYYDWFFSTPVMLFTISMYFFYVNFVESDGEGRDQEPLRLLDFVKGNAKEISGIVALNCLMLLFGFLAERGIMQRETAFILGTGGLIGSFGIIYKNYAKHSEKTRQIFWFMFALWSMYGVAFLYPPVAKNLAYTALDIFAKNFFGLFLTYKIYEKAWGAGTVTKPTES